MGLFLSWIVMLTSLLVLQWLLPQLQETLVGPPSPELGLQLTTAVTLQALPNKSPSMIACLLPLLLPQPLVLIAQYLIQVHFLVPPALEPLLTLMLVILLAP